ncbi:MAG: dihydrodipicolinate synthase family protein [Chloroflexi bacterium]|nr:dihydrodipicolinate synthase family protein [Chloroflexota bacterium]
MIDLRGIIPPLATPLHADESLNLDAIPALAEHVLAGGVHGIFVCGSQGEAFALSAEERRRVLDAVLAAVNGRVPIIAGTGAITTRDAVALSRQAEESGADAVAAVTPFFITPTQDELVAYYTEIAAAVSIPLLGYSNPMRTGGVRLLPDTLARLAGNIPHFVGVKDSSGDLSETAAIIRACPADFRVFVGRDTLIYGGLCYGAAGAVGLTVNIAPALAVGIYTAFQAGDHAQARAAQDQLAVLRERLPRFGTYPVQVKEALNLMGLPAGPPRRPVLPLPDGEREGLRALLVELGIEVQNGVRDGTE